MDMETFLKYFARVLMVLFVLPIREVVRGNVAKKLGDDTAEVQGRLTLNPVAHLDPLGSLMIILIGFGWTKPMPINPTRMKNYRAGFALTSLAGPVANFLSAFILAVIYNFACCFNIITSNAVNENGDYTFVYYFMMVISFLISINVSLGVFTLLPIPPLDGYGVISYFLPPRILYKIQQNMQAISFAFIFIILFMNRIPNKYNIIIILSSKMLNLINFSTGWIVDLIGYGAIGA